MAKFTKPPADPRGKHIRLYADVFDSNAWNCLTPTDKLVWLALRRDLGITNNGDLSLVLKVAKSRGIKSATTLAKSLRALVAVGLIKPTIKGALKPDGTHTCNLYRFTDVEVFEFPAKHIEKSPATNDWKSISTIAKGRALIRAAEAEAAALVQKKKKEKIKNPTPIFGSNLPNFGLHPPGNIPNFGVREGKHYQKLDLDKLGAEPYSMRVSGEIA